MLRASPKRYLAGSNTSPFWIETGGDSAQAYVLKPRPLTAASGRVRVQKERTKGSGAAGDDHPLASAGDELELNSEDRKRPRERA